MLCFALRVHCIPSPCIVAARCTHSTNSAPVVMLRFVVLLNIHASSVRRGAICGRKDMQLLTRSSCRALLMVTSADCSQNPGSTRHQPRSGVPCATNNGASMIRLPGRCIFGPKKADVQHQPCRYETIFHSVLRSRWEHPLSFCVTSALPYCCLTWSVAITCH